MPVYIYNIVSTVNYITICKGTGDTQSQTLVHFCLTALLYTKPYAGPFTPLSFIAFNS